MQNDTTLKLQRVVAKCAWHSNRANRLRIPPPRTLPISIGSPMRSSGVRDSRLRRFSRSPATAQWVQQRHRVGGAGAGWGHRTGAATVAAFGLVRRLASTPKFSLGGSAPCLPAPSISVWMEPGPCKAQVAGGTTERWIWLVPLTPDLPLAAAPLLAALPASAPLH